MYNALTLPVCLFFLFRMSCTALPSSHALQGRYKVFVAVLFCFSSTVSVVTALWGLTVAE